MNSLRFGAVGRRLPLLAAIALVWGWFVIPTQPAESAGNLGLHLGYAKARDAEEGNGLVGGHLEFRLARFLGIQGAVDYRHVESYEMGVGDVSGKLDVQSIPVTLSGRLHLPGPALSPYVLAGAGWYTMIYDYSGLLENAGLEDDSEHTFGWHVGAGLDMSVSPMVSLFGEARAVYVDPDRNLDQGVVDSVKDFDYDSFYLAGGFNLHF